MTLAQQLYDAQVAWVLDRLRGEALDDVVAADVDTLLALEVPLAKLVDADEVKRVARTLFANVPGSPGAGTLVNRAARILHQGPAEPFALADVLTRDQVEALVDQVLRGSQLAERTLDDLARSPLVGTVASRFVGRLVAEVLAANKSVASKIPGLGGLVSLGTGAASMVMGAADKQFEALLGGGATFAARRLNKIVLETLRDPTTRQAVMQVWDMYSDKPLPPPRAFITEEDMLTFVGVVHAAVTEGAGSEPIANLVDALIDGFFTEYGARPPAEVLTDLEIGRDQLVEDAVSFVRNAAAGLDDAGQLEAVVRERLEPFWRSPQVAAILSE